MVHELKCWPYYFERVKDREKTFEVRKNDRDFQTGDVIILKEWDPKEKQFTGRLLGARIGYILPGGHLGIEPGYCVMQLIF